MSTAEKVVVVNAASPPPAGWYPDPAGRAPFRYWDGVRWTEHTQQGTAPEPVQTVGNATPPPPPGYAPAAPQQQGGGWAPTPYGGQPPVQAARPAGAPAAPLTGEAFVAELKRFDGWTIVVVGVLLFILGSFLPWVDGSAQGANGSISDSSNAWAGDGLWMIRGVDVTIQNLQSGTADGGTDMVILLPVALIAVGVAVAQRLGKPIARASEIVLGASALLAVLMVAEAISVSGAIDDLSDLSLQFGVTTSGSLAVGFYFSIVAALVAAAGAARTFMASRNTPKA